MNSIVALLLLSPALAARMATRITTHLTGESQEAADRSARVASLGNQSLRSRYRLLELLHSGAAEEVARKDNWSDWWPFKGKTEPTSPTTTYMTPGNRTPGDPRRVGEFPWSSKEEGPLSGKRYPRVWKLGKGGFGDTWKAYDAQEQREVAVKILYSGFRYITKIDMDKSDSLRSKLHKSEEECSLVQRMMKEKSDFDQGKEHICDCYASHIKDGVEDDDVVFLVMELCGTSLESKLAAQWEEEPSLEWEARARHWMKGVLEAVRFMSSLRTPMQHFDIKLDNVVVNDQGEAKLIDFGLSVPYTTEQETFYCPLAPPEHSCEDGKVSKYPKEKAWLYDVWTIGALHYNLICLQRRSDTPFTSSFFSGWYDDKQPSLCVEDFPRSPVFHETPPGQDVDWALIKGCLSSQEERSSPGQLLELLERFP